VEEQEAVGIPEFNLQFNIAKTVVRQSDGARLVEQQERLRGLVPLMDASEQAWATRLIERLPELTSPPAPPSALMVEALRIREAAQAKSGSREEMISALTAARERIWEIADRAPKGEGARIRGLTRTLDHMEEALGDPFWEVPEAPVDHQD